MRVGSQGFTAHSEVDYLRESVESYCIRAGSLYAHFRRFTSDWNPGECPKCQSDTWGSAETSECDICYGTGYVGGFAKPVVQWMVVQDENEQIQSTQLGMIRLSKAESMCPFLPKVQNKDLLARLVINEDGEYDTAERFVISGMVRPHRLGDDHVPPSRKDYDHLTPETNIAAYLFNANYLYENTEKRKRTIEYEVPFKDPFYLANPDEYRIT